MDKINGIEIKLYILEAIEGKDKFQYEYGNLKQAKEAAQNEKAYTIYAYGINEKYYYIEGKVL